MLVDDDAVKIEIEQTVEENQRSIAEEIHNDIVDIVEDEYIPKYTEGDSVLTTPTIDKNNDDVELSLATTINIDDEKQENEIEAYLNKFSEETTNAVVENKTEDINTDDSTNTAIEQTHDDIFTNKKTVEVKKYKKDVNEIFASFDALLESIVAKAEQRSNDDIENEDKQ